jgi:hypothetical protein
VREPQCVTVRRGAVQGVLIVTQCRGGKVRHFARAILRLERLEERCVPAAVLDWQPCGPGGGGALFAPAISPIDGQSLYFASDMGQVFRSTNAGQSWAVVDAQQLQGSPRSQVRFTEDPNILYVIDTTVIDGSSRACPSISRDAGQTWNVLPGDPTHGEAFSLFVDPADHQRVLVSNYRQLFYSNDAGASFAEKFAVADSNNGLHLAGAFFDGDRIFVGTNVGLLVSKDSGATFAIENIGGIPAGQVLASFAGAKQGDTIRFLATVQNQYNIYAGVGGDGYWNYKGLYSLDWGTSATWIDRSAGVPADGRYFYVRMAENDIQTAYLGGGAVSGGVPVILATRDGGMTWQHVLDTSATQNVATGWAGYGGRDGWWYGGLVMGLAVSATNSQHIVFSDYGFAYQSRDGGATWACLNVKPEDLNPAGQPTPRDGTYRSSGLDNSTSWQVFWANQSRLLSAYTDIRGALSDDGGQSWSFQFTGQDLNTLYRVWKQPTTGVLYAATASIHDLYQTTRITDDILNAGTGRVLVSRDNGSTWLTIRRFTGSVVWVEGDPARPNRLYACVVHSTLGGIYVTDNLNAGAAATWRRLAAPPRTQGHPFNLRVLADGSLLASYSARLTATGFTASSGVFLSRDGGRTWSDRTDPRMRYWTKDVVVDPSDPTQSTWYAGVWSGWGGPPNNLGGLYRTTNRGLTWTRLLPELHRVSSVTFSPVNPDEMYVTTETEGLWWTGNARADNPTFTRVNSFPFRQPERVFFNPYDPAEVWVSTFGNGLYVGRTPNAPGALSLSSTQSTALESAGYITFTVQRLGGSQGAIRVDFATVDGTARAGLDYEAVTGTLEWADGDTSPRTVQVPLLDNYLIGPNRTFRLALSNPQGGGSLGGLTQATGTIVEDDRPGRLALSVTSLRVLEDAGTLLVTVQRTGGLGGTVQVNYATGSILPQLGYAAAVAGVHYTPTSGVLVFAPGQATQTFVVPILDNTLLNAGRQFAVRLSRPAGGATLGTSAVRVTIQENDSAFVLTRSWLQVSATSRVAVLEVVRLGNTATEVSIDYSTRDGTARAGEDYAWTQGTLHFAAGQTRQQLSVSILRSWPTTRRFAVQLSNPRPSTSTLLGRLTTCVVELLPMLDPSRRW